MPCRGDGATVAFVAQAEGVRVPQFICCRFASAGELEGTVTYNEFIEELHKMRTEDVHMMLNVIRRGLHTVSKELMDPCPEALGACAPEAASHHLPDPS